MTIYAKPELGSIWRNRNGESFEVYDYTNTAVGISPAYLYAERISYKSLVSGKHYSRDVGTLSWWYGSMARKKD